MLDFKCMVLCRGLPITQLCDAVCKFLSETMVWGNNNSLNYVDNDGTYRSYQLTEVLKWYSK